LGVGFELLPASAEFDVAGGDSVEVFFGDSVSPEVDPSGGGYVARAAELQDGVGVLFVCADVEVSEAFDMEAFPEGGLKEEDVSFGFEGAFEEGEFFVGDSVVFHVCSVEFSFGFEFGGGGGLVLHEFGEFVFETFDGHECPIHARREFEVDIGAEFFDTEADVLVLFVESVDTDDGVVLFLVVDVPSVGEDSVAFHI